MSKFVSIFLFVAVLITYAFSDYPPIFDSLPVLKNETSSQDPSKKTLSIVAHECPPSTDEDIDNMALAAENEINPWPELLYCVFTLIQPDIKKCQTPVKPIFLPTLENGNSIKCGFSENHNLYSFGFYRCGSEEDLKEFQKEDVRKDPRKYYEEKPVVLLHVYKVCYDTSTHETIWTSHGLIHPVLFDEIKNRTVIRYTIRTDPFQLENVDFADRKKIYELEAKKDLSPYKMRHQPLVPAAHLAFDVWKKTTYHIINQAPIYEFLVPLMSAIDLGLKEVQMMYYRSNPLSYTKLKFYTRVIDSEPTTSSSNDQPILKPNIWHKFVYDEAGETGSIIYIHNAREPPKVKNCDTPIPCDFAKWTDYIKIGNHELKHAYCCPAEPTKIEEIFSSNVEVKINGTLDLNSMFKGESDDTNDEVTSQLRTD